MSQAPRYVDLEKCTSCGECAKICPIELSSEFDAGLGRRKAAYKRYAQAIPGAYAIDKHDKSPCKVACPAGIAVQGYVNLIAAGRYAEALEVIRRDNPLPAVCGRVCTHPCESACARGRGGRAHRHPRAEALCGRVGDRPGRPPAAGDRAEQGP